MKLKILKVKDGSFEGNNGVQEYFWYQAENLATGEAIQFGSKNSYEIDKEYNIAIEKSVVMVKGKDGVEKPRDRYKESSF